MRRLTDFKEKYLNWEIVCNALVVSVVGGTMGGIAYYVGYRMGHKRGMIDFGKFLISIKNEK